jgi:hypothetical protein
MQKLIKYAVIAALALTSQLIPLNSARAQQYQALAGLPATIPAATTTNLATPVLIDAHGQDKVGFTFFNTWSTAGESTGNTNLLYTLAPTDDFSTYSTNNGTVTLASYNWSAAGGASRSTTNITAGGHNGWYVIKIQNTSAAGVATNSATAFLYSVKLNAP